MQEEAGMTIEVEKLLLEFIEKNPGLIWQEIYPHFKDKYTWKRILGSLSHLEMYLLAENWKHCRTKRRFYPKGK